MCQTMACKNQFKQNKSKSSCLTHPYKITQTSNSWGHQRLLYGLGKTESPGRTHVWLQRQRRSKHIPKISIPCNSPTIHSKDWFWDVWVSCAGEVNITSTTISSHTVKPRDNFAESVRQLGDPGSFEQWQNRKQFAPWLLTTYWKTNKCAQHLIENMRTHTHTQWHSFTLNLAISYGLVVGFLTLMKGPRCATPSAHAFHFLWLADGALTARPLVRSLSSLAPITSYHWFVMGPVSAT